MTLCHNVLLLTFEPVISILIYPKSTFAQKLIVCKLTPHVKTTLSGRWLKKTNQQTGQVEIVRLDDERGVMWILHDEFRMELTNIDLAKSDAATNSQVWGHL